MAIGEIEMVEKSEELQALRAVRNMRFAHTYDPEQVRSSAAKWHPQGCERK